MIKLLNLKPDKLMGRAHVELVQLPRDYDQKILSYKITFNASEMKSIKVKTIFYNFMSLVLDIVYFIHSL